ncbi:MAG: hypothetical protein JO110_05585 [Acetobacteraceae bacterium]|nr:hypothetical protein [Acetobacteraceae bacterium]
MLFDWLFHIWALAGTYGHQIFPGLDESIAAFLILLLGLFVALYILSQLTGIFDQYVARLLTLPFRLLMLPFGLARRGQQLGPYEKNRGRAVLSAFVLVFSIFILRTGGWPLDRLAWGPPALLALCAVSCFFLLAALYGARNGPRDAFGAVASLVIAVGSAFLLSWQVYLPREGGNVAYYANSVSPGLYGSAADFANRLLPGVYLGVLWAALLRALISIRLLGGAQSTIARAMRRRAANRPPLPGSGFWARTREAFAAGRAGRPWE